MLSVWGRISSAQRQSRRTYRLELLEKSLGIVALCQLFDLCKRLVDCHGDKNGGIRSCQVAGGARGEGKGEGTLVRLYLCARFPPWRWPGRLRLAPVVKNAGAPVWGDGEIQVREAVVEDVLVCLSSSRASLL